MLKHIYHCCSVYKGFLLKQGSSLSLYQTQALLVYVLHFYFPSLNEVPQLCWPVLGPSSDGSRGDNGNNHLRWRFMLGCITRGKAVCQQYTGTPLQFFRAVPGSQIPFPFLFPSSCFCVNNLNRFGKPCCVSKCDNPAHFLSFSEPCPGLQMDPWKFDSGNGSESSLGGRISWNRRCHFSQVFRAQIYTLSKALLTHFYF